MISYLLALFLFQATKSPPKRKRIDSSDEESFDIDDVPAPSRTQRSRKAAQVKYVYSGSEDESNTKENESNDWDIEDDSGDGEDSDYEL